MRRSKSRSRFRSRSRSRSSSRSKSRSRRRRRRRTSRTLILQGYPGSLLVSVTYRLGGVGKDSLTLDIQAASPFIVLL